VKRPSFQFYPGDWLSNKKLRRCSPAERGAWIDLICLLHDPDQASEYGVIRWPLREIAQALGCPVKLLQGLREKGVLKGVDAGEQCAGHTYTPRHAGKDGEPVILLAEQPGPLWFSSRMLEDEHIRLRRATQGGAEASPKGPPKGGIGAALGEHPSRDARAQSSSSSSSVDQGQNPLSGAAHADAVDKGNDTPKAKALAAATASAHVAIDYLNAKAGTKYRHSRTDLKFAIDRILIDGATEADLKAVVDAKVADWKAGKFERTYLRPETLWNATKFSGYIGQVGAGSQLATVKTIHVAIDLKAGGGRQMVADYTWTNADFNAFELVIRTARNPAHRLLLVGANVEAVVVFTSHEQGIKGRWSPAEIREGLRKAA